MKNYKLIWHYKVLKNLLVITLFPSKYALAL